MTFDSKWDGKYDRPDYIFGQEPNSFLRSQIWRARPGGCVLTIGEGEGRNAVWLARQGFDVTAVEGSAVGVSKARALAAAARVEVDFQVADLLDWAWPLAAFDAVVSIFVHFQPDDRRDIHRAIERALKPGGLVFIEGFHPRHRDSPGTGGPPMDMMVDARTLIADFEGLAIVEGYEGQVLLDEGERHQGLSHTVRFVARA